MSSLDLIASSVKTAWAASMYTGYCPVANIYYGRAQQPSQLAGFPYMEMEIKQTNAEVFTHNAPEYSLITYMLTISTFTVQGQTGGSTSGDAMTDQGNILRALEAVLNFITPNVPWNAVTGFLHCLPNPGSTLEKDSELYQGRDVFKSTNQWTLLIQE